MDTNLIENVELSMKKMMADSRFSKSSNPDFDYILTINNTVFNCLMKGVVSNSSFGGIISKVEVLNKKANTPLILIVQSIYPSLMSELSKQGINYIDMAGNCHIITDGLILHVEGQKEKKIELCPTGHSFKSRLFKEAGLKIIFEFLWDPELVNLTYRRMQDAATVSIGSVSIIMKELIEAGYILKTEKGNFLKNRKELLDRWVVGYNEVLKPKLFKRRMTFKDNDVKKIWKNIKLPEECYWGGEPGANLCDGYIYPELYTIYGGDQRSLIQAGLRPDNDGEIFVYHKFWTLVGRFPILLIYADLMGSGISRNIEAAQRIYNNELQYLK